ncbi:sigma-70 family RNA polymerase sigma factor [Algicella marina]|uniref:Sigma-70 family RNA polymerase sigma factor n=1 Tax=Algicella marina TaxID=2683284 RepID=A0A6P1SW46_9RHOB|nr:sigma-70 family RNA polymerase sigma factor [Algicella marina]QHQ33987.1 sigma-70 family RNA polymerase sigma factor [Algicella marina]
MALDDPEIRADARALRAYASGAPGVAEELTAAHVPRVLALAMHMLGDRTEAEDVAQEAMMRLWKIAPDWEDGRARISTWLYRVTANLCTDRLRRRGRQMPLDDTCEPEDPARSVEAGLIEADRVAALREALGTLPEKQRLAVTLRHLEERGNPEIAEIMGVSVEAVESLIARGKRGLSAALMGQAGNLSYKDGTT